MIFLRSFIHDLQLDPICPRLHQSALVGDSQYGMLVQKSVSVRGAIDSNQQVCEKKRPLLTSVGVNQTCFFGPTRDAIR